MSNELVLFSIMIFQIVVLTVSSYSTRQHINRQINHLIVGLNRELTRELEKINNSARGG